MLHKCTKNHDDMLSLMLFCSWDMVHDGCNYFSFWAVFCPFTPVTPQKIKISQKWRKHLEISSFYTCVPKIMIRWCTVPERWCVTDGQTGEQKKWHIEVRAPPKNNSFLCQLSLLSLNLFWLTQVCIWTMILTLSFLY